MPGSSTVVLSHCPLALSISLIFFNLSVCLSLSISTVGELCVRLLDFHTNNNGIEWAYLFSALSLIYFTLRLSKGGEHPSTRAVPMLAPV